MDKRVQALRLTGIGFYIVFCILLGLGGGFWLDSKFNTHPIFIIGGLLAGLAIAGYGVYRLVRQVMNDMNDGESK